MQDNINEAWSWLYKISIYHKTRIDCCTDITAKRVPTLRIEEVPELSEIMIDQKFGSSVIEPGIEFVNDWLVSNDTENSDDCGDGADQNQNGDSDGWLPSHEFRLGCHIHYYELINIYNSIRISLIY